MEHLARVIKSSKAAKRLKVLKNFRFLRLENILLPFFGERFLNILITFSCTIASPNDNVSHCSTFNRFTFDFKFFIFSLDE